jgi:hypothetical protein
MGRSSNVRSTAFRLHDFNFKAVPTSNILVRNLGEDANFKLTVAEYGVGIKNETYEKNRLHPAYL